MSQCKEPSYNLCQNMKTEEKVGGKPTQSSVMLGSELCETLAR